jgi:Tol biopolymer transport system component
MSRTLRIALLLGIAAAGSGSAAGQTTTRLSHDSIGVQGNGASANASISRDGTLVVFQSAASNLVTGDANGLRDVFVRDLTTNTTECLSRNTFGGTGDDDSDFPTISADERYVAFRSGATNLGPLDFNGHARDIYVVDRTNGSKAIVSMSSAGVQGNDWSHSPALSSDGRYVAFSSLATNLVAGDTNGAADIFVRDQQQGTTIRVSVNSQGVQANGDCWSPALSYDGRYVAFSSPATNLHPLGGSSGHAVFVRDTQNGTTTCASLAHTGEPAAGGRPTFSPEGRYIGYCSGASLLPGDTNNNADVFLYDIQDGVLSRIISSTDGSRPNSEFMPSLSQDARFIAFDSDDPNLVAGDSNGVCDVFIHDRLTSVTMRVSLSTNDSEANGNSAQPSITPDGNLLVFHSDASGLVTADTNGVRDVFLRDRRTSSFTTMCEPGVGGVIPCPCGNLPVGADRGCNNSASTGGASLVASGVAYLSSDNVVIRSAGERPSSLSILMQGNGVASGGIVHGQGVRCVSGTIIRRLFVKQAVGGSITAPDFATGDPTISARSAAKGDTILPGQSRWYLVYYRDPIVLGGCPATSTFNATQTGQVTWAP